MMPATTVTEMIASDKQRSRGPDQVGPGCGCFSGFSFFRRPAQRPYIETRPTAEVVFSSAAVVQQPRVIYAATTGYNPYPAATGYNPYTVPQVGYTNQAAHTTYPRTQYEGPGSTVCAAINLYESVARENARTDFQLDLIGARKPQNGIGADAVGAGVFGNGPIQQYQADRMLNQDIAAGVSVVANGMYHAGRGAVHLARDAAPVIAEGATGIAHIATEAAPIAAEAVKDISAIAEAAEGFIEGIGCLFSMLKK